MRAWPARAPRMGTAWAVAGPPFHLVRAMLLWMAPLIVRGPRERDAWSRGLGRQRGEDDVGSEPSKEAGVQTCDQSRFGWTVVLRRKPARIVGGQPEGRYGDAFEIICCACGDDPDLDYHEVSDELQRIRGHYPVAVGIAAYVKHARLHQRPQAIHESARRGTVPGPAEAAHGQ